MNTGRKMKIGVVEALIGLAVIGLLAGWWQLPTLAAAEVTQEQIGEACAGLSVQPSAYATAYFIDPTANNQKTQVATTMTFAKPGTSVIYNSTTGSTTTASITSVPCGTPLAIVAGEGGATTFYYNAAMFSAVDRVSVFADLEVIKSGAATLQLANDTALWASSIYLGNNSITDPDTSVKLRVKVPTTAGALFGDKGWALCVKYNAANFTQVYPQPYVAKVSIPHITSSGSLNTLACYEMPGLLVSAGSDWEGSLYLNPAGTYTGTNATTVDIVLVDKTSMLFNGGLVVGYDTGVTDGLNTDAGRTDVTVTSALTVKGNA